MTDQAQILPGTLDLLILKAVSLGPLHGYGILLRIGQISGQALLIEQGALYLEDGISRRLWVGVFWSQWIMPLLSRVGVAKVDPRYLGLPSFAIHRPELMSLK